MFLRIYMVSAGHVQVCIEMPVTVRNRLIYVWFDTTVHVHVYTSLQCVITDTVCIFSFPYVYSTVPVYVIHLWVHSYSVVTIRYSSIVLYTLSFLI